MIYSLLIIVYLLWFSLTSLVVLLLMHNVSFDQSTHNIHILVIKLLLLFMSVQEVFTEL